MKKFLFFLLLAVSIVIFSEQFVIDINDEGDFNEIVKTYNSQYFYHIEESYPVIPSYKIFIQFDNDILIDSSYFLVESIDTLKDFALIAGENPLPKIFFPSKRSSLKLVKNLFPEETYRIFKSKSGGKIFVSGYVNNFYYESGKIFRRKGKLVIVYKNLDSPKINTKSKNEFLIITADSLKSYWTGYVKLKKDYTVNIVGVSEIFSLYPTKTKSQAIREYLKTLYEAGKLAGVLLGGDVEVIPPFMSNSL